MSVPSPPKRLRTALAGLPLLNVVEGYWERAGWLRASIFKRGRKARIVDALIAQSCLDHGLALITRDRDCRRVVAGFGLVLVGR